MKAAASILLLCFVAGATARAASPDHAIALSTFSGAANSPQAPVAVDRAGNIFGSTDYGSAGGCTGNLGCGALFEFTPARNGVPAALRIIHNFHGGADGSYPTVQLTLDPGGTVYGYTAGNSQGTVFRLTPSLRPGNLWNFQTIYTFTGGADGTLINSYQPLILQRGHLFGLAYSAPSAACPGPGCGTLFRLDTPANGGTIWRQATLYTFPANAPPTALAAERSGALYASTGANTIVRLAPKAGVWNATPIATFPSGKGAHDPNGLIAGADGTLYGLEAVGRRRGGAVFRLAPPASPDAAWRLSTIGEISVGGGYGPSWLAIGPAGSLIGSVYGDQDFFAGTAFQLTPPAPGATAWTTTELWHFGRGPGACPIDIEATPDGTLVGVTNDTYSNGTLYALRARK